MGPQILSLDIGGNLTGLELDRPQGMVFSSVSMSATVVHLWIKRPVMTHEPILKQMRTVNCAHQALGVGAFMCRNNLSQQPSSHHKAHSYSWLYIEAIAMQYLYRLCAPGHRRFDHKTGTADKAPAPA